jgi:hypothetical protein
MSELEVDDSFDLIFKEERPIQLYPVEELVETLDHQGFIAEYTICGVHQPPQVHVP